MRLLALGTLAFALLPLTGACDDGGSESADAGKPDAGPPCEFDTTMPLGGAGHAAPLGSSATEARAGRAVASDFPVDASPLLTWKAGDWILANDKIALVIEDVGASDLYDPWGGRPVGLTLVEGGKMVKAANFGEFFILTNRETVVTDHVTVMNDGSNGEAAVIRASGSLRPLPFYDAITRNAFRLENPDIPTAIDYVLEPGAEHIDVYDVYRSGRRGNEDVPTVLHGFMFGDRMPRFTPGRGFVETGDLPWLGSIDDLGASFAYAVPGEPLGDGIGASGFVSKFTERFTIEKCSETRHLHARLTVGGPGLDGLLEAVSREAGTSVRAISGTILDAAGQPAAGVRVHAERDGGSEYLTRATSDAAGHYTLHVPSDADVQLTAYRRGDSKIGPVQVLAAESTHDFTLAATGLVHVTVEDAVSGQRVPARVQILEAGTPVASVPDHFGEPSEQGGRLHVEYAISGETTLRVPAGTWKVVVSRGYEYEIFEQTVANVTAGQTVNIEASLEHVVDTAGVMCADFHIHTIRSNDSGDDATRKVSQAVADGLDIPVRSDHEWVDSFQPIIEALHLDDFALGIGSIEMTSMELWGHMGVVPLVPDPDAVNQGAPLWQKFPDPQHMDVVLETKSPAQVFREVRQRPEQPIVIINHPHGDKNYFGYVGFDPVTGLVSSPDDWDEDFSVVEFFNNSSWSQNRGGTVTDWLGLLDHGRRVFATGASDSHGISYSPTGYPRTCLKVGTDDPHVLTPNMVRDAAAAGHSTISGGVYVDARVGTAGPGDDVTGAPASVTVHVRVQAASWVDVDTVEVVVDGVTVDTIAILPGDANPSNEAIRFEKDLPIQVAPGKGSYVIIAAYGDHDLSPVHPGHMPFGVTNPIFLSR